MQPALGPQLNHFVARGQERRHVAGDLSPTFPARVSPASTSNRVPKKWPPTRAYALTTEQHLSANYQDVVVLNDNLHGSLSWRDQLIYGDRMHKAGQPSFPMHFTRQAESSRWRPQPHHASERELWLAMREEALMDASIEPSLASFYHQNILMHNFLDRSLAFVLANKLSSPTLLGTQLNRLFNDAYEDDPSIIAACVADLNAVFDRDPACEQYSQCFLYFKGFQAVQCYRVAHWLWNNGRKALALALQSSISERFHVDIHPAAQIGRGVFMDHATGVVIGETAVVGDNVSMLHHVTLGGSGTGKGARHPKIGHGVLLGAGVNVLGPVEIGAGSKIGAGSVVVTDLPPGAVAVGVPARVIKRITEPAQEPSQDMDQCSDFILDYVI